MSTSACPSRAAAEVLRSPRRLLAACLAAGLLPLPAPGSAADADEPDGPQPALLDFRPEEPAEWTLRNVAAWFTLPFGAWNHWYAEKVVLVDTVPSGAELALFYVRANFQKLSERAQSPVRVRLPSRIDSTPRDLLSVRAVAPGHASTLESFRVHEVGEQVLIRIKPLANVLVELGHVHLAGRTTLWLRTREPPDVRVTRPGEGSYFTLALHDTASELAEPPEVETPLVSGVQLRQIGEDVIIQVSTRDPGAEVRSKTEPDPVKREHVLVLDVLPAGARAPSPAEIRGEVDAAPFDPADPCALAFERSLARDIAPEEMVRAHRSRGTLVELYQQESMQRLGRLSGGAVHDRAGQVFRTGHPLELALALESAGEIEGYLALLGAVARGTEEPAGFLRAMLAPDRSIRRFEPLYAEAEAARSACR